MSAPLIIAHRGVSAHAPENTLASLRMAVDVGADGVEFDVRLSNDGVPVVIHDATLLRTAGIQKRVGDMTAEQLSRVDAGSWFNVAHPNLARPEFSLEGVPTLRSVLALCETVKGPIYVEIKSDTDNELPSIVGPVCREIADHSSLTKVIVGSFSLGVIPLARALLPGVRTAALFAPKVMRLLRKKKYLIDVAREIGADHLSLHRALVSRNLLRKAREYDMPVTVWTVNSARWISRAADRGIYALIADEPAKLLAVRSSMQPGLVPEEIREHENSPDNSRRVG